MKFKITFVYLEGKQFPIVISRSNKRHFETSTLLYLRLIVSASQYYIIIDIVFDFLATHMKYWYPLNNCVIVNVVVNLK